MEETYTKCINELRKNHLIRNKELIIDYIKLLPFFMEVIQKDLVEYPDLLIELVPLMHLHEYDKDKLIFRYGEKQNSIYLLLNGKATFVKVNKVEYKLTVQEYIEHLLKLRKNSEYELLKECIVYNNIYKITEENFNAFMRNIYNNKFNNKALFSKNSEIANKVIETYKLINSSEWNKNCIDYTLEKYINDNKIGEISNKNQKDKKICIIPEYEFSKEFKTGMYYGELTNTINNNQKTAIESLISIEKCIIVTIDNIEYDRCIKDLYEKKRKRFISLIFSFSIFHSIPQYVLEKMYYNYFNYTKFNLNDIVIEENTKNDNIYFILSGEFEFYITCNIIEINNLIIYFKGVLNKLSPNKKNNFKKLIENEEKENDDLRLNQLYKTNEQNKILLDRHLVRLGICHQRDIIGMRDYTNQLRDMVLISSKCISTFGEAYYTKRTILNKIYENGGSAQALSIEYQIQKINFVIERLMHHKRKVYSQIKKEEYYNINIYIEKKIKEKEKKQKNRFYICENNSIFGKNGIDIIAKRKRNQKHKEKERDYTNIYHKKQTNNTLTSDDVKENIKLLPKRRNLVLDISTQRYIKDLMNKNAYNDVIYSYMSKSHNKQNRSNSYNDSHCKSESNVSYVDCLILDKFHTKYYDILRSSNNKKINYNNTYLFNSSLN